MLGKIVVQDHMRDIPFFNPNLTNLVAEVSTKQTKTYNPAGSPTICAVDCGLKMNQVKILASQISDG